MAATYDFTPHRISDPLHTTDCRSTRGRAAFTDRSHPQTPPWRRLRTRPASAVGFRRYGGVKRDIVAKNRYKRQAAYTNSVPISRGRRLRSQRQRGSFLHVYTIENLRAYVPEAFSVRRAAALPECGGSPERAGSGVRTAIAGLTAPAVRIFAVAIHRRMRPPFVRRGGRICGRGR